MVDESDWRLQGQERYLQGVALVRRRYHRPASNPNWDHDHCEFCMAKFMVEDVPDVLHEGYVTTSKWHWICETCFQDFQQMFGWQVVSPDEDT
jgi:hypothetical protein